ncbi:MAG: MATE family efflux transporter [Rikenellaceae bacterium]
MTQSENKRYTELRQEKVGVLLRRYSIPAIVSMVVVALYNIVDRIYIGHGVGSMAIAGLTLTLPISSMIAAIGTLVGAGASSRMSIVLGMNDIRWARNILGHVPILTCILSLLFIIPTMIYIEPILYLFGGSEATLPYARDYLMIVIPASIFTNLCYSFSNVIRASGFPKKSMSVVLVGVLLNVILDPIFIFWFDMGIRGAAIATAISMFVGAVYAVSHFMNPKHEVSFHKDSFKIRLNIIKNILSIGFSPFIMNFIASAVAILVNNQLRIYGGDIAIGSFGIINSYQLFISFIVLGLCQGMQPIIGFNYGARNNKRVKDTFFLAARASTIIFGVGLLLMEVFPRLASMIFTSDPELIELTIRGMRIAFAAAILIGIQIVISHFFTSIGKAMQATIMTISRQLIFLIPLLAILPMFWGLDGVWLAIPVSDILAFLLAMFFILREKRHLYPKK